MRQTGCSISLRQVGPQDWRLWRKLRLQALEEAPYAFSSRLADWQGAGDTEERWRSRLTTVPFNIVAGLNGTPVGMVSATSPDKEGLIEMISMWVAPLARGGGIGNALVRAVIGWAQEEGASRLALAVTEGNDRAAELYRRHGFVDADLMNDGHAEINPELKMIRDLSDSLDLTLNAGQTAKANPHTS